MIKSSEDKQEFISRCNSLFDSYCQKGYVSDPHRPPIMYSTGEIARAGDPGSTHEAKMTGHKSAKSIASRVKRDSQVFQSKGIKGTAKVSDVTDMTRCTMIIGSFAQAPSILSNLRKELPALQVSICDHSDEGGYSAIHLKGTNEQGIPYEVQLHTPESFYIKQISEYEYAHWREFNYKLESEKVSKIKDPVERRNAQLELDSKKASMDADNRECEEVYKMMHEKSDARISDDSLKQEIKEVAQSINDEYKANLQAGNIVTPQNNPNITCFDHLSKDDSFSQEKLAAKLSKSNLLTKVLPEAQAELVEGCEKVLKTVYVPAVTKITQEELSTVQDKNANKPVIETYNHTNNKENSMKSEQNDTHEFE